MNPRFVRSEAPRSLQLLNGSRIIAQFKEDSTEDVMSERQAGIKVNRLLGELQSGLGFFVSHVTVCDLKPGQGVVRGVSDLFFESRDGPLVVALGEQITSASILHARRFRVIDG